MRIALFSGNYNYVREGANQALNRLVSDLEARGHVFRIYSPMTSTPAFEPAGTLVPVPSITLPRRREFQLALGLSRAIRADIHEFAPDLVHVSTPDILGTRAQSFAKTIRVPVVASMHTRFEAYLSHYSLGWARPLVEAHLRRFYRRSNMVLVPTVELAKEMRRLRGDGRVAIWSRGVDRDLFAPSRRSNQWRGAQGWSEDDIVILFLGRIVIEKGIDRFVEVVERLRSSGHAVRALVVGEGPAKDRATRLAGATLTGHLDGEALATAVASADIMVSPSTTETFGNVVLEAMASSLAVVSVDAPSAAALIENQVSGILCSDRVDDYAAAVAALIAEPARRRALGVAARCASAHYSWDAASLSVERAYTETLSGDQPGSRSDY